MRTALHINLFRPSTIQWYVAIKETLSSNIESNLVWKLLFASCCLLLQHARLLSKRATRDVNKTVHRRADAAKSTNANHVLCCCRYSSLTPPGQEWHGGFRPNLRYIRCNRNVPIAYMVSALSAGIRQRMSTRRSGFRKTPQRPCGGVIKVLQANRSWSNFLVPSLFIPLMFTEIIIFSASTSVVHWESQCPPDSRGGRWRLATLSKPTASAGLFSLDGKMSWRLQSSDKTRRSKNILKCINEPKYNGYIEMDTAYNGENGCPERGE